MRAVYQQIRNGFSLLEILAVMAIIGIVLAFIVPATGSLLNARNLENAGQGLLDQLNLARQEAIARNREIEFRIYKFQDQTDGAAAPEIRAVQFFQRDLDGSKKAISRVQYLPQGIVISENPAWTTLAALPELPADAITPKISRAQGVITFRGFQFHPEGDTSLDPATKHFLTLKERKDGASPPKNYASLSIEPTTGRVQIFRP